MLNTESSVFPLCFNLRYSGCTTVLHSVPFIHSRLYSWMLLWCGYQVTREFWAMRKKMTWLRMEVRNVFEDQNLLFRSELRDRCRSPKEFLKDSNAKTTNFPLSRFKLYVTIGNCKHLVSCCLLWILWTPGGSISVTVTLHLKIKWREMTDLFSLIVSMKWLIEAYWNCGTVELWYWTMDPSEMWQRFRSSIVKEEYFARFSWMLLNFTIKLHTTVQLCLHCYLKLSYRCQHFY